jgi:hypothetical protein
MVCAQFAGELGTPGGRAAGAGVAGVADVDSSRSPEKTTAIRVMQILVFGIL